MEKRLGSTLILIQEKESIHKLNIILSDYSEIILGRQGLPLKERDISIISILFDGTQDQISSLTGQIGRLKGVSVKTVFAKQEV
jgi:putative iron-only hydrogenase system regulator